MASDGGSATGDKKADKKDAESQVYRDGLAGHPTSPCCRRVTIANVGRRPVTITHVGFNQIGKGSDEILCADSIKKGARELGEGKSTSYLLDQTQIVFEKLKDVLVTDATGKTHRKKVSKALK